MGFISTHKKWVSAHWLGPGLGYFNAKSDRRYVMDMVKHDPSAEMLVYTATDAEDDEAWRAYKAGESKLMYRPDRLHPLRKWRKYVKGVG